MKVTLAHDYLTQSGGAERVVTEFCKIYPDSDLLVLMSEKKIIENTVQKTNKVINSWLQYLPWSSKKHHWYLIFMPDAIETLKVEASSDVVLSSASSFAKGVRVPGGVRHVCYCHTPTRYLWHDYMTYIEDLQFSWFVRKIVPRFLYRIKNWDYLASQKVDIFIANSRVVQKRIKKYYDRDSQVVYPPVDTDKFSVGKIDDVEDYFLIGGRLVAYKKYDLAIRAFNKLGIKLKIFGDGPERSRLENMAFDNIEFLGKVSNEKRSELLKGCRAFIYPQVEDFGITAVEAMASGRPVIAYAKGGAMETVVAGKTGEFFEDQNWESLAYTILHFDYKKYNPGEIRKHAEGFGVERFREEIKKVVRDSICQGE